MRLPLPVRVICAFLLSLCAALAADFTGKVQFGGLPLPGATVTATQGDKTLTAITGPQGDYLFPDIAAGVWNFEVQMLCFETIKRQVTIGAGAAAPAFDLKLLPLDQIKAIAGPVPKPEPVRITVNTPTDNGKKSRNKKKAAAADADSQQNSFQRAAVNANPNASAASAPPPAGSAASDNPNELNDRASDALLANGSVNNGASSPFSQAAAFGNNRRGFGSLYNGGVGFIFDDSATDARTFSFTGQDTPKPAYTHMQGVVNFGGPLRIPHLLRNGPQVFFFYNWERSRTANTTPGLMPTEAERAGDFAGLPTIYDPTTSGPSGATPFPGNIIPASRISPQAASLLNFYPMPNFPGANGYNYQVPIVGATNLDSLQSRVNKNLGNRNQLYGVFTFQRSTTSTPNIFNFLDTGYNFGLNSQINWSHRFSQRMFMHFALQYSRQDTQATPYFANRENVSGAAGITGNNQDPLNWGPPTLSFSSGISQLTDGIYSNNRNQTVTYTYDSVWNYGRHNISYGVDYKRLEFNYFTQSNPRGTFGFTGLGTAAPGSVALGSDFADFLLGTPDTSQIAYGNADKYMRESLYDAFVTDDWRVGPSLTVSAGVRWEYSAPITELYNRLVNLDVAPGFSAIAPVVATDPVGPLTGEQYPTSLLKPDKTAFEPRVGIAWRPIPASSLVVRAGYSVNYNTSVYQTIAADMAQQAPLSHSLSIANSAANPLTLANGFTAPAGVNTDTFAIDPNFRIGYAQNWNVSVQRDLPGSLVMIATYTGIKGTRGPQEFIPNTYPAGAANPCPSCPAGFIYMTSNGNSTREAGSFQLRRRLHSGFTASALYTWSKSIDDSALGGKNQGANVIAQNWLDLSAERGLSPFDQRNLLSATAQYTTGQGLAGGTLLNGWRGTVFKEWTTSTTITAGSGLPLTPTVLSALTGTGIIGPVRPDYTGAPIYTGSSSVFLNSAAYAIAPSGQWGNAGRDSITGPSQFTLNAALARTFRLHDRYNLDIRVDATNLLNHVSFTSFGSVVGSPQFGIPTAANAMRSLQTTIRVRF